MSAVTRKVRETDLAMGFGSPECPVDVTVILPALNENGSIEGIYNQMVNVLEPMDLSYEILFVDDGSTDDTWDHIAAVVAKDSRVRALRHRRNYGKASALANGFSYARGDIMVTSDADMQYDPTDVVRLVNKVREGWDVVSAYKVIRRDPLNKRIPSKFFNFWVRSTTGVELHDFNAGLKAYRQDAARDLVQYGYGELHRFFILLAAQMGYSVTEVPVESLPRTDGTSKYGAERYLRGAFDYMTVYFLSGYKERPMHFLGTAGLVLGSIGTAVLVYLGFLALFAQQTLTGRPSLTVAVLFILAGIQFFVFGLMAEMINNLERGSASRAKISQVLGVDRRTSPLIAPQVQVDRRRADRTLEPELQPEHMRDTVVAVAPAEPVGPMVSQPAERREADTEQSGI